MIPKTKSDHPDGRIGTEESQPLKANDLKIDMRGSSQMPDSQRQLKGSQVYETFRSKFANNSQVESENLYNVEKFRNFTYDQFKTKIDQLHFRKVNPKTKEFEEHTCCDVVCGASISGHCCCGTSKETSVDELGVGVSLYFKGLKHLIWNYLFFTIISIPILFFCIYASKDNSISIDNFQEVLETSTVGNIGQDARPCFKDAYSADTLLLSYSLTCISGTLSMKDTFNWGFIYSTDSTNYKEQDCTIVDPTNLNKDLNSDKSNISKISDCEGKNSCEFSGTEISLLFKPDTSNTERQFYLTVYCSGTEFTFPNGQTIEKRKIAFLVAGIDAFIVLWFFFMIFSQKWAEQKTIAHIIKEKRTSSHFTIQISNLPTKITSEAQLMSDLHEHIQNLVSYIQKSQGNGVDIRVVDVKISEQTQEIQQQIHKGEIYKVNLKRIADFLDKYDPDRKLISNRTQVTVDMLQKQVRDKLESAQQSQAIKDLKPIELAYVKIGEATQKIQKIESNNQIKFAWVTFETTKMRDITYSSLTSTLCEDFCSMICCCCHDKEKMFMKKQLIIDSAPNPDSILWQNNDSGFLWVRKLISLIITVAILVGSYILIVWIRNEKQKISQKYPRVNCSQAIFDGINSDAGLAMMIEESKYTGSEQKVGYTECYCRLFIDEIISQSMDEPELSICQTWFTDYTLGRFLPYAAVLSIIIINMIIQMVFAALSRFEKYKLLDEELKSNVIKTFIAQFINTGLILLLTNISFSLTNSSELQFLFGGSYTDLSPQWFRNVGTVIILTLLINVVSAPLIAIIFTIIRKISQFFDRGCGCDERSTKHKSLNEWVDFYTGPDFLISFRYSQILGICFIGMLYSGGIPILYFTSFLHLVALYWIDKVYIFRVCKKPLNYSEQMADMVRHLLYAVPFLHTIFSIYIYGNTDIFFEIKFLNNPLLNIESSNAIVQKFIERVLYREQNYAHGLLFVLFVVAFIIRSFLFRPCMAFVYACSTKIGADKYKDSEDEETKKMAVKPFHSFLSKTQLQDEIGLLEFYKLEQESNNSPNQKFLSQLNTKLNTCQKYLASNETQEASQMIGIVSYDIRQNPQYRKFYAWDKLQPIPQSTLRQNQ